MREVAAGEAALLRLVVAAWVAVAFVAAVLVEAFAEVFGFAAALFLVAVVLVAVAFGVAGLVAVDFVVVVVFRLEAVALLLDFATVLAGVFGAGVFLVELGFFLAGFRVCGVTGDVWLSVADLPFGEAFGSRGWLSCGLASVDSLFVPAALSTVWVAAKMVSAALTTLASSLSIAAAFDELRFCFSVSVLSGLATSVLILSAALGTGLFSGAVALPAVASEPAELAAELRFLVLAAVRRTGICFLQPKCEFTQSMAMG